MQVFVAFDIYDFGAVLSAAQQRYPNANYPTGRSVFIATQGQTTREVATSLGLGDNNLTSGIVVPVTTYWGRHDGQLWEWIAAKQQA